MVVKPVDNDGCLVPSPTASSEKYSTLGADRWAAVAGPSSTRCRTLFGSWAEVAWAVASQPEEQEEVEGDSAEETRSFAAAAVVLAAGAAHRSDWTSDYRQERRRLHTGLEL